MNEVPYKTNLFQTRYCFMPRRRTLWTFPPEKIDDRANGHTFSIESPSKEGL